VTCGTTDEKRKSKRNNNQVWITNRLKKSVRYLSYFLAFHALHDSVVLPSVMNNIVSQITKGPCPFVTCLLMSVAMQTVFTFDIPVFLVTANSPRITQFGLVPDVVRSVD